MTLYVFLLLLIFFLIFSFVRLCNLCWPHHCPAHSAAAARHTLIQRLLKPRSPRDCPACRLSCTLSSGVGSAPLPVRPWREVKSRRGAPMRMNTEGFACPNHQCPYSGITDAHMHAPLWRWHAWPCRADPDVSRPCLSHHFHCSAPHPFVPSENSLPSSRSGADCASLRAGSFCR
jgi:hypothetical protein